MRMAREAPATDESFRIRIMVFVNSGFGISVERIEPTAWQTTEQLRKKTGLLVCVLTSRRKEESKFPVRKRSGRIRLVADVK